MQRTQRRTFCRGCGQERAWRWAGWATDGHENTVRPRAFYRVCATCGLCTLALGGDSDLPDAEAFCRSVLKHWLRQHPHASDSGHLDLDAVLGDLREELWRLYGGYQPGPGGTFRGYASELLPRRLSRIILNALGDAKEGRRREPKMHSPGVSVSLDELRESGFAEATAEPRRLRVDLGRLTAEARATMTEMGLMILAEWSAREIADELGLPATVVVRRLAELRAEVEQQQEWS